MNPVRNIKTDTLILLLMGIVCLLMVANLGLFLRMNQLQNQVIETLKLFQPPRGLEVGSQAPPFQLKDTHDKTVSLQDMSGESILLVFSWC